MLDVNKLPALKAAAGAFCKKVTCTESKWNEPFFKTRRGVNLVYSVLKNLGARGPKSGVLRFTDRVIYIGCFI